MNTISEEHNALVHPDGSECKDGCDAKPMLSYQQVRGQRDELLAALERVLNATGINGTYGIKMTEHGRALLLDRGEEERARSIIAKCKAGA